MLLEPLLNAVDRSPDKIAVADPKRELTYKQLVTFAEAMARVIATQTDCPRVGICLPSSAAFMGGFFGSLLADKVVVPINFLLARHELSRIIEDAGIDLIITCQALAEPLRGSPIRKLIMEQLGLKRRMLLSRLRRRREPPPAQAEKLALILYTSGTDGAPKGVCLTHGNLRSNCEACIAHARMNSEQSLLGVLPLFHSFGITTTMLVPIVLGATVVYMPRFQPAETVRTIAERRISISMAIPSMYNAVLRVKEARPDSLSSLVLPISGGEPLPPGLYDAFLERFDVPLLEGYGLTETSPVVSLNTVLARRKGTVGRPIPGVQVRVVDERGGDVRTGGLGELLVRGPNVMQGYHNKPEATASAIDASGWLRTGDLSRASEDGFISICGRKKDMIIVGGENVFPREIEHVLQKHPAVAEAAVVGVPDGMRGEAPAAFVTLNGCGAPTSIELRDFCRGHLANYKVPRHVHIAADLPRGPTGKILKRDLRPLLQRDLLSV